VSEAERLEGLIAAEQDERRRLALFLHDGPVQDLSGIALMLDAALHALEEGDVGEAARIVETALERHRATIRELRNLSFVLEPVVLRDQGLGPALQALAEQLAESHGVRIELAANGAGNLGETAQIALYTILRELVEQAMRRDPAVRIEMAVSRTDNGGVTASVGDDAVRERRRRSFEAIEERVKALHGEIEVTALERGTRVRITLPPYVAER